MLSPEKNQSNNMIIKFGDNSTKLVKKLEKLKKILKSEKLSKNKKLFEFDVKEVGLNFLISNTRIIFKYYS